MHPKVFVKLKKTLKTLSSGKKNPKKPKKTQKKPQKPKKNQKNPKKPTGLVFFFKKNRVFSNPANLGSDMGKKFRILPDQDQHITSCMKLIAR
jgi:hypothetical protein